MLIINNYVCQLQRYHLMRKIIKKLLIGKGTNAGKTASNPLRKRIDNIKSIWENEHHVDAGIEKIIRLFLSSSQLLFPGIYIKYFANKKGPEYEDLALDLYVLSKVLFPLLVLINGFQNSNFVVLLIFYLVIETLLYIPTLIFASDLFAKPRSYKRSMLLIFFNYAEIVLAFAVFYFRGNYLNQPLNHWFDAVYFSIITSSSIGYGDIYPVTLHGKMLVSAQALVFLFFVVLFLNFFAAKFKSIGYFNDDDENLE